MNAMTRSEIDAALALAGKATTGPWMSEGVGVLHGTGLAGAVNDEHFGETWAQVAECGPSGSAERQFDNAAFIAASRALVPALAREVLRWRKRWAFVSKAYDRLAEEHTGESEPDPEADAVLAENP